ncbi:MAG: multiheme c-type cytochrome [Planctomycetota bacterium]|jgi:tetratricopeptide (TPR) repeat protein
MSRAPVAACLAWLAAASAGGQIDLADQRLAIGDPMPDFSLPRGDGAAGELGLEHLGGRPAVLVFWRPRQDLSLEALRDLEALRGEIGAERLAVLAVDSARSSAQEIQAALAGENLSYPVALDPQRALYGQAGVIVSPTTFLLDGDGVLRFRVASHPHQYRQVVNARVRFLLGDIDEAQMEREIEPTVLKIDHELAAAWRMYNLGRRLQSEGKADEAVAMFEKAVSEYPALAEARCALGFTRLASGDLDAAGQHFQTALTYQPDAALARLGQAAVLARTQRLEQAEQILLSLLGHQSIAVRVRYELGRIYRARGDVDMAAAVFEDALSTMFPEPRLDTAPPAAPPAGVSALSGGPGEGAASPPPAGSRPGGPVQTVAAVVPPADAEYLGVKRCKKCHFQQWKSWSDTKMAKTFEVLRPGAAADAKADRGLDPQEDYTGDTQCLSCHTTGYGHRGGYRTPPPGDAAAARTAGELAGVGCEACHGPGSVFVSIHEEIQDSQRTYEASELHDAGQYRIATPVCAGCHRESAPCISPGYTFDFEQRKEQGTHRHYDLKYRIE